MRFLWLALMVVAWVAWTLLLAVLFLVGIRPKMWFERRWWDLPWQKWTWVD